MSTALLLELTRAAAPRGLLHDEGWTEQEIAVAATTIAAERSLRRAREARHAPPTKSAPPSND